MTKERFLELDKMTMGDLLSPSVSREEFDFMMDSYYENKNIDEIEFDE